MFRVNSEGGTRRDTLRGGSWRQEGVEKEEEEEDWMLEVSFDHEWLAGGGGGDTALAKLSAADKAHFTEAAHKKADAILEEGGVEALQERETWTQKFVTEHMTAVSKLRHNPVWTRKGQRPCRRHVGAGEISGLFTYGGPGTALCPLTNPQRQDGKFPGMRVLTQRFEQVDGIVRAYHDPFGFLAGLVGLKHPHMDLLLLPMNNTPEELPAAPQEVPASRATSRYPRSDMAFWTKGHHQDMYAVGVAPHRDGLDPKIYEMLHLARAVDPSINKHSRERNALEAGKVGWNLVAQSTSTKLHPWDILALDNTSLFQNPTTKACALSFVPTHHTTQWLANFRFAPVSFCGIWNVHKGFRNQVRRAIRSPEWASRMRPALAACPELYVTGHSLGAGQAQLVAACLQRAPGVGEPGWRDYQHMIWTPHASKTKTMPAMA